MSLWSLTKFRYVVLSPKNLESAFLASFQLLLLVLAQEPNLSDEDINLVRMEQLFVRHVVTILALLYVR